ncbi:hypothetical protein I4U23_004174 [Adineta vaga]|nr:hypothetical protein I4U23_004174 [Adineta vaga]
MYNFNTESLRETECQYCHQKYPTNYLDLHEAVCPLRDSINRNSRDRMPIATAPNFRDISDNNNFPLEELRPEEHGIDRAKPINNKKKNNLLQSIKNHKQRAVIIVVIVVIIIVIITVSTTLGVVLGRKSTTNVINGTDTSSTDSSTTTTTKTSSTISATTTKTSIGPTCLLSTWNENGTTIAGSQDGIHGDTPGFLYKPRDLFIDNNDVYITDTLNRRIIKYTLNIAQEHTIISDITTRGIAFASEKQIIYFSNFISNMERIERVNKDGSGGSSTIVPSGVLSICYSLVVRLESTYICDTNNHRVILWFNVNSSYVNVAGGNGFGTDPNKLQTPEGIFVDDDGNIYVADTRNHRIQLWKQGASEGKTVGGSSLSLAGSGMKDLRNPTAVIVDKYGTMFIADTGNHRIVQWLKDDTQAKSILVGRNGLAGLSLNELNRPTNLKFDSEGNLVVVDSENNRIQKYLVDNSHCL